MHRRRRGQAASGRRRWINSKGESLRPSNEWPAILIPMHPSGCNPARRITHRHLIAMVSLAPPAQDDGEAVQVQVIEIGTSFVPLRMGHSVMGL